MELQNLSSIILSALQIVRQKHAMHYSPALKTSDKLLKCIIMKLKCVQMRCLYCWLYLFRGKTNSRRKQIQLILSDTKKHLIKGDLFQQSYSFFSDSCRTQCLALAICQASVMNVDVLVRGEGNRAVCSDSRK